jgi:hypothetical protein
MPSTDWIAVAGVAIQFLLLAGLVWYCIETRWIRISSQAQLEALHAPCMTFKATPREEADAILELHQARGAMILDFIAGSAVLLNIGTGPAVNISYMFIALDEGNIMQPDGYVPFLSARAFASIPVSRASLANSNYSCAIQYESLSQTQYSTTVTIRNLVLTPPIRFDTTRKQSSIIPAILKLASKLLTVKGAER